ncbi:MAG: enoyl-CoA hydratase/isomerase family protein, partial [Chloroflexi bacterium]|nr:enoyl-CoA hydratase/isomerase family protein [Chloroflexota bacterium]
VITDLETDGGTRVVILTGAGRGFCAGADVSSMASNLDRDPAVSASNTAMARLNRRAIPDLAVRLRALRQPVIAAVNGVAAGAGMSLSMAADIRIASQEARFSAIFVKRGLIADTGSTHLLPRLIGTGFAAELIFTGAVIDVERAREMGLVNRVVEHQHLLTEAMDMAETIAANPPLTVQMAKGAMYRGLLYDLPESVKNESYLNNIATATEDFREGVRAFAEKRTPQFTGR